MIAYPNSDSPAIEGGIEELCTNESLDNLGEQNKHEEILIQSGTDQNRKQVVTVFALFFGSVGGLIKINRLPTMVATQCVNC